MALVAALLTVVVAHGPWKHPPEELGAAVERALDMSGHESDGGPEIDPLAAADAVRRCLEGTVSPDPVGRVDCALALLGLLDSDVLEATVLRLTPEELHELFAGRSFTATGVARAAVRLLWEHASAQALERLVRTRTFGFLEPVLSSPRTEFVLRFVSVGHGYVRATLRRVRAETGHAPVALDASGGDRPVPAAQGSTPALARTNSGTSAVPSSS